MLNETQHTQSTYPGAGDRATQGTSTLEREDQRDSQGVHVADGPSGHDSVGHGFLELPER